MKLSDALKHKERLVFGRNQTLKLLRAGKLEQVFLSSNALNKDEIKRLAELSKVEVVELKQTNEELGPLCKKTFAISVLGVKKEG